MYKIVNSKHKLDMIAKDFWDDKFVESYFSNRAYPREKDYFSVIDNYIINIKLSKKAQEDIELLYNQFNRDPVKSFKYFLTCFNSNFKCSINLALNAKKAKFHRNKFDKIFGFKAKHRKTLKSLEVIS